MENKGLCQCDICGSNDIEILFSLPFRDLQGTNSKEYDQRIAYCPKCKFIFTQNPLSEEALNNRYKNESKFEYNSTNYFLEQDEAYIRRCNRQKQFIDLYIKDRYRSIFEVGASSGYNLSLYPDIITYGIEPSELNCNLAKKIYGIDLFNGTYQDYLSSNTDKLYDLLFLSHTLEHIVNPLSFLKNINPRGSKYVFIEVPTFDYKYIDEPFSMFCEEHVNYFSYESLENLMYELGYKNIAYNIVFEQDCMLPAGNPSIATLWEKSDNLTHLSVSNNLKDIVCNYIEKSKIELQRINTILKKIPDDKRIAVWGVGHHASMLAANTVLSNKDIVRVYDSDSRKYKYKFCEQEIRPFDEKDIYENNIDVIIVTTYTAQKAISKVLKKYENDIEVIYLYSLPI